MARRAVGKRAVARRRTARSAPLGEFSVRAMVMGGAARVFAKQGVRAASVEDILEAAGLSRRTFYRVYQGKEDVALELYRLGTQRLVETCRVALGATTEPTAFLERCIDAHLANAREFGRLVFVLGGEAQRHESALHARRMEVQEILAGFLASSANARRDKPIDPLLFRALMLALEGITRIVLEEGDEGRSVSPESIERVRRVMKRIAAATLAASGAGMPPLPIAG
jgi:AcrR family transcriptional regulator